MLKKYARMRRMKLDVVFISDVRFNGVSKVRFGRTSEYNFDTDGLPYVCLGHFGV